MPHRSPAFILVLLLLPALSGCSLLRQWYEAAAADALALKASAALEERRARGVVTPANEGLTHLALRAETWVDYTARSPQHASVVRVYDLQR